MNKHSLLAVLFILISATSLAAEQVVVTPPDNLVTEDYTFAATYYDGTNYLSLKQHARIGFSGDDVYVQGFSYYNTEAWVKGTLSSDKTQLLFDSPQYYGDVQGHSTYFIYCKRGTAATTYPTVMKVGYNASTGQITFTDNDVILEGSQFVNDYKCYGFWFGISLTKGYEELIPTTAPEGLTTEEYALIALDQRSNSVYGSVMIGFDGADVYVQGMSTLLPKAWIKGTLSNDKVTFPHDQFLGVYQNLYNIYLNYNEEDVVFNYDSEAGTFTATDVFTLNNDTYHFSYFQDCVIKKSVERIATPATPTISQIYSGQYGDEVVFSVPTIDTEGNAMVTSKLSFQFYSDIEHDIQPITFEAGLIYTRIDEDITEVPYGFTDHYDFFPSEIYLNMDHSKWNRIGIQSIYRGLGDEHRSEISWFDIKDYGQEEQQLEPVAVPEDLETVPYSLTATDPRNNETFTKEVLVGFYGNEVYMQQLSDYATEGWVKGTLTDGTVTMPECFLGTYQNIFISYDLNFSGATFSYDENTGIFSSREGFRTISGDNTLDYYTRITMRPVVEMAATPAKPKCQFGKSEYGTMWVLHLDIPMTDTNGNPMVSDKLSYLIMVDKMGMVMPLEFTTDLYKKLTEDMTEIPFNFTDLYDISNYLIYMNQPVSEMQTWQRIGVQSIYRGLGEEHKSEIGWFDIANYWAIEGISDVVSGSSNSSTVYSLSGQRLSQLRKGINIVGGKKIIVK